MPSICAWRKNTLVLQLPDFPMGGVLLGALCRVLGDGGSFCFVVPVKTLPAFELNLFKNVLAVVLMVPTILDFSRAPALPGYSHASNGPLCCCRA